jgi:type I restriction enzyme R subunit
MNTVGQIERTTQKRVVALFRDLLGYAYLGNWIDREGNQNIGSSWKKVGKRDGMMSM